MISYQIYKVMHFLGLFLALLGLGAAIFALHHPSFKNKKLIFSLHGIGLFLVLLGGFGMMARLGLTSGMPGWIIAKLVVWLLLGGLIAMIKRIVLPPSAFFLLITILTTLAAYLAIYKPF